MTKKKFVEMMKEMSGKRPSPDGKEFEFEAFGKKLILYKEVIRNGETFYNCQEWELDNDGEPYCRRTWIE